MLQLTIRGLGETTKYYEGLKGRMKTEPTAMTEIIAMTFHETVRRKLTKLYSEGSAHNTPTSLKRRLHYRKFTGGHSVFFDRVGDEHEQFLPELVEFGSKKSRWDQPNNPIWAHVPGGHPRIRPKHFWKDSLWEMERRFEGQAEKLVKKIIG